MNKIGDKIKYQRKIQGFTLEELAKAIGVTSSTISKYEKGSINIPSDKIEKLAVVLKRSPAYFMGWEESKKNEGLKIVARSKKSEKTWDKFNKLSADKKRVVTDLINLYFDTEVEEEE